MVPLCLLPFIKVAAIREPINRIRPIQRHASLARTIYSAANTVRTAPARAMLHPLSLGRMEMARPSPITAEVSKLDLARLLSHSLGIGASWAGAGGDMIVFKVSVA